MFSRLLAIEIENPVNMKVNIRQAQSGPHPSHSALVLGTAFTRFALHCDVVDDEKVPWSLNIVLVILII